MKRTKLLALLLCTAMLLALAAGCQSGGTNSNGSQGTTEPQAGGEPQVSDVTELNFLFSGDVTDWNYLVSTNNTPSMYIDSLVEYDYLGLCKPCLAESWERSEDGLTWTFHLRKGVKWMTYDKQEYAEVTADDFVASANYILDASNASRLADMMFKLKGAEEYYGKSVAGQPCDFSTVGVKAVDDYTLEYTLEAPCPYFLSSLTYKNFFPANRKWIEECGDTFSTDHETMLYCGEYIMTNYVPQQTIESTLNPTYWDMDNMHITKINETYNAESYTVAPEMFLRGEINYAEIPTDQLDEWLNDPAKAAMIRPCRPSFYTYFFSFNFWPQFDEKYEPDNWKLAVNNVNFRKSIMHAIDKRALIEIDDPYNTDAHLVNGMTPADFVAGEGGVDYTQLAPLKDFTNSETYNVDQAAEYKAKAMEELTAAGAHFPVIVYLPYDVSGTSDTLRVQVLQQMLERNLGTDYVKVEIEGYSGTDFSNATIWAGNYGLEMCVWMADYLDPLSYTDPIRVVQNLGNWAYTADGLCKVSDTYVEGSYEGPDGKYYYDVTYDDMVAEAASEYVDLDKRYNDLAACENWLVNEMCMVIPFMRGGLGYVASNLMPFEAQYAAFGASSERYKYQHIYDRGIDTDAYYAAYDAWQKEREDAIAKLNAEGKEFGVDY